MECGDLAPLSLEQLKSALNSTPREMFARGPRPAGALQSYFANVLAASFAEFFTLFMSLPCSSAFAASGGM